MHKQITQLSFQKSGSMGHHVLYECNELSLSVNHHGGGVANTVFYSYNNQSQRRQVEAKFCG